MLRCTALLLLAASAQATFDRYAGYLPLTQITDEAAIDLDQLKFNEELYDDYVNKAKQVYIEGGNSGSFAMLNLTTSGSAQSYLAGSKVVGKNSAGATVEGNIQNDISWGASDTAAFVNVTYKVASTQASYMSCQVGGLYKFGEAVKTGCKSLRWSLFINVVCLDFLQLISWSFLNLRPSGY